MVMKSVRNGSSCGADIDDSAVVIEKELCCCVLQSNVHSLLCRVSYCLIRWILHPQSQCLRCETKRLQALALDQRQFTLTVVVWAAEWTCRKESWALVAAKRVLHPISQVRTWCSVCSLAYLILMFAWMAWKWGQCRYFGNCACHMSFCCSYTEIVVTPIVWNLLVHHFR